MSNKGINIICKKINKKYGILVYSGTIAIESALLCLNIKENDKVMVSSTVCYSIIEAILRVKAIPVIVVPKNGLYLKSDDVLEIIKKEKINCIILVHQYGIASSILDIKKVAREIPIIEDIAQAYDIKVDSSEAGINSDIVITSFGKTKPLSLGYGGALFANSDYRYLFDYYNNESRDSSRLLLPYTISINNKTIDRMIKKSKIIIKHQRNVANILQNGLKKVKYIHTYTDDFGFNSVWHRFPIIVDNKKHFEDILSILNECNVLYQLPHQTDLIEIPLINNNNNCIIYRDNYKKENVILIRTRNNKISSVKKFIKRIDKI